MLFAARVAGAQAQAALMQVGLGDRDFAARNLVSALQHYEEAVKIDSSTTAALWKASNAAIDLG
jgi:hypothetical protein